MPLQIFSAGSGIHPLRHCENPHGPYPCRGLPAFAFALHGRQRMLRIETATLTERAAHADELRGMVNSLQAGQGRETGGADKPKPTKRRRTEPEKACL